MLKPLRQAAVRVVKPRVSAETWAKLREIDPLRRKRRGQLAVRPTNPARQRVVKGSTWRLRHGGDPAWRVWRPSTGARTGSGTATLPATSGISHSCETRPSPCWRSASAVITSEAPAAPHCECGSTSFRKLRSSDWTSATDPSSMRNASSPIRATRLTPTSCASSPGGIAH